MAKIKLLNLNTLHGGQVDEMYAFLKKENADIMTLQEVLDSQDPNNPKNFRSLNELKRLFPDHEYDFAAQANWTYKGNSAEFGTAIFSRFPIKKKSNRFFTYPYDPRLVEEEKNGDFRSFPRNIQHNEILIGDKILSIFNVHGIWGFDGNDNEDRYTMSKIIIAEVSGKKNVILAGDTNTWMHTEAIQNIRKIMIDPFKGEIKNTFNMNFKPATFDPQAVDLMLTSSEILVEKAYMPMDDVSDHRPLIIEFDI